MCLGIPGQIVDMVDVDQALAKVEVSGAARTVSLRLLDDEPIDTGDWVLVHVGFAMAKIDEEEAAATIAQLEAMGREYQDEVDAFRSTAP